MGDEMVDGVRATEEWFGWVECGNERLYDRLGYPKVSTCGGDAFAPLRGRRGGALDDMWSALIELNVFGECDGGWMREEWGWV